MIKTQLNNGLRVVMEKIPTFRSVSFGIWVKTGSRNEKIEENGISHFIEHMLFKGTERFSAKEIAEQFDAIGGNVNAFTSKEYTCYYFKVLDQHLEIAMDVLSDMFFHSQFDEEELKKEKNVILEEISMYEDTPDDMVHDLLAEAAYGSHSLAFPILGTEERLQPMDSAKLHQYMKEHYTLDNTVISIAGNYNDGIIELLEKYFGGFNISGGAQQLVDPDFMGDLRFYKKKTEQNHICLTFPGLPSGHDNQYAMLLLNNALGGGMSSRLFQEIREKRGLAYSVYSYHSSYVDSGLFSIYAGTAPKQTKEVLELTKELLLEVRDKGLTEDELHKGKEQMKGSLILGSEGTGSRMNRLGKNELMLGKHYTLDEIISRIEAVKMEDVQEVIARMFKQPFALAMVGSSDKVISGLRRDELVVSGTN
ncbi:M16 family metallopeptidase [Paenibacillus physcomitrellae]|uniref:Zinc protease YmxG n=1 Tax=Paenibacillus physcomitrellae TaxID=1619311 RepID=A0ABQ1G9I9_9BACL|nr:pitrilysin family protein [Paenibacillus physcomitrellae]GGA39372.1 putative zinc protease YmxG [Paenibacillus physcomitrellae]